LSTSRSTSLRSSSSSSSSSKRAPQSRHPRENRDVTVPQRGHAYSSSRTSSFVFLLGRRRMNRRESFTVRAPREPMPVTRARSASAARLIFQRALKPARHRASAFSRPTPGMRAMSSRSASENSPRTRRFGRAGRGSTRCGLSSVNSAPHAGHSVASASTKVPHRAHANFSFACAETSSNRKRPLHFSHTRIVGFEARHSAHGIRRSTSLRSDRTDTLPHDVHSETGSSFEPQFRQGRRSATLRVTRPPPLRGPAQGGPSPRGSPAGGRGIS